MNFQDFLINTTTARSGLKPSFNTGETPTQQNFHDLIDGLFLLQDDSVYKDANNGLAVRTGADDQALLFFDHESQDLTWSLEIKDGLHIKDKDGNARFSVLSDGKVGIGNITPSACLHVVSDAASLQDNTAQFYAPNIGESSSHIHWGATGDWYIRSAAPEGKVVIQDGGVGNVGIGTDGPGQKLDIKGKLRVSDQATNTENVDIYYQNADVNETLYSNSYPDQHERAVILRPNAYQDGAGAGGAGFQFWTQGITGGSHPNYEKGHIQAMVIRKNGNIGIGTASPGEKLNVYNGNIRLDNGFMRFDNTPSSPSGITGYCLVFYRDGSYYNYNTGFGKSSDKDVWFNVHEGSFKYTWAGYDRLTINLRSNTSAYYVIDAHGKIASSDGLVHSSDLRFKKDITPITSEAITKLGQLQGKTFQWRTEEFKEKNFSEGTKIGFIAQEMLNVYPELVNEGGDGYYSINYSGLIPILTEAVKDLNNKNEALEARVLHLEKLVLSANIEA
ncbi:tail fiber domain-containing protein [Microscilla marina]|uniref:Cell wall surface anchor family protein n=1 Tax=Microscilla marina ATCC 23134 TaxID=313606 RepID=A1ZC15_MICM2|nr:tail fiber domain-containing protein [Microscilla marina]EAY31817.1 cell wall surface anchor family protein [Microscilla marina ATCC 23134]